MNVEIEKDETSPLLRKEGKETTSLSKRQATAALININVGLAVLGLPFAFKESGEIASIVMLTFFTLWSAVSAYWLMQCFGHPSVIQSNVRTFQELGEFTCGRLGYWLTFISVLMWSVGALCAVFLNVSANLAVIFNLSNGSAHILSIILCIPTLTYVKFQDLKLLSILGTITPFLVTSCIVCMTYYVEVGTLSSEGSNWSFGAGIFILCYSSAPAYPEIYNSMKNKKDSTDVVIQSFSFMLILNLAMGICGYFIYGASTSIILTENLHFWPGNITFFSIAILLWISIYCMISPLLLLIWNSLLAHPSIVFPPQHAMKYRILLFVFITLSIYPLRTYIPEVEAFVGNSCGIITTFLLPTLFHYTLFKNGFKTWEACLHWASLIGSVLCCVAFIIKTL